MSNQEAIALLRNLEDALDSELNEEGKTAFRMAIEALSCSENPNNSDCISRQAAIDALWEIRREEVINGRRFENHCSLSTAVDVIRDLPSAQPELAQDLPNTCTDAISRQAAIDATWFEIDRQTILNLPPAQPERIRGRWIEKPHVYGVAYCSLCDYELHTNDTNFCPNCGADMRGEQDG